MLKKNKLAKKYNTERYIRTFSHIYYKWSILVLQYKSTWNLDLLYRIYNCIWLYEYILLSSLIYTYICYKYIYIYIYIYMCIYIYKYILYIYKYILYIYIYIWTLCFLLIATLPQLIRTMVTLVSHSFDLSQLVLLVDTAYTIVKIIQVINKEDGAT